MLAYRSHRDHQCQRAVLGRCTLIYARVCVNTCLSLRLSQTASMQLLIQNYIFKCEFWHSYFPQSVELFEKKVFHLNKLRFKLLRTHFNDTLFRSRMRTLCHVCEKVPIHLTRTENSIDFKRFKDKRWQKEKRSLTPISRFISFSLSRRICCALYEVRERDKWKTIT